MKEAFLRVDVIARGVGLGALALFLGALSFQYLAGLAPCEMCHWQRWPHIAAAVCGLLIVPLWEGTRYLILAAIGLAAVTGLAAAYQWGMLAGWQPVLLAAVIIGLPIFPLWKADMRLLTLAAIALVLLSGLIGLYQTGMQLGYLPGPSACSGQRFILGSNMVPQVQCDRVTWSLFGLSMASYNAIFSFLIAGLGGFAWLKAKDAA